MADFDVVVSARLVDAHEVVDNAWIGVTDGKVAARGQGKAPRGHQQIDAQDHWLIPGVVDGQVHSGSQAGQEGLGWASRAAAAGARDRAVRGVRRTASAHSAGGRCGAVRGNLRPKR